MHKNKDQFLKKYNIFTKYLWNIYTRKQEVNSFYNSRAKKYQKNFSSTRSSEFLRKHTFVNWQNIINNYVMILKLFHKTKTYRRDIRDSKIIREEYLSLWPNILGTVNICWTNELLCLQITYKRKIMENLKASNLDIAYYLKFWNTFKTYVTSYSWWFYAGTSKSFCNLSFSYRKES